MRETSIKPPTIVLLAYLDYSIINAIVRLSVTEHELPNPCVFSVTYHSYLLAPGPDRLQCPIVLFRS